MPVVLLAMTVLLLLSVGAFVWAAVMRMTGRRSRFDTFAETFVRAQGAAVYPPSLRPDPVPPVMEQTEDGRATRAQRDTPAEEEESANSSQTR